MKVIQSGYGWVAFAVSRTRQEHAMLYKTLTSPYKRFKHKWHNYTRSDPNTLTRNKRAEYNNEEQTMFISFKKMFDMLKDIDNNTNEITELKKAIKKLQADKTKQSDEPDKKVMTQVNMSRATAGLTLITVQVFHGDELVNVITTTSTTAHFNGEGIQFIKDGDVNTFGTREDK